MTQPPESGKPRADPRRAFLDAVSTALDDYDAATTAATSALLAAATPRLQALVAASDAEQPHVSQLPARLEYDAPHGQRQARKVAVLAFAARVSAALPAGNPSIRVGGRDGDLTVQAAERDFDHATAARIAATLGLDGHTRHTDEQQRKDFHTWFHGDNEHDSPLRLVWSGPSETAVAE